MKKSWGITMCKDEEDIIFHTLVHLAEEGLDGIIVADNMSSDNTMREILKAQKICTECKIIVIEDKEVGYYQSRKMTALARLAYEQGADWILPFDADELWYAPTQLKQFFNELPDHINVVNAKLFNHFGTGVDKPGIPFQSMEWRLAEPGALPKVAFKWQEDALIGQGNHSVMMKGIHSVSGLEIRHFPYRSWEHFYRKAKNGAEAYNATDLPQNMGSHWRSYFSLIQSQGEGKIRREVFERYFWFLSPVDNGLIYDPAPFRRFNK